MYFELGGGSFNNMMAMVPSKIEFGTMNLLCTKDSQDKILVDWSSSWLTMTICLRNLMRFDLDFILI